MQGCCLPFIMNMVTRKTESPSTRLMNKEACMHVPQAAEAAQAKAAAAAAELASWRDKDGKDKDKGAGGGSTVSGGAHARPRVHVCTACV